MKKYLVVSVSGLLILATAGCGILMVRKTECREPNPAIHNFMLEIPVNSGILYRSSSGEDHKFVLSEDRMVIREHYYTDTGCDCTHGTIQIYVSLNGDSLIFSGGEQYLHNNEGEPMGHFFLKYSGERYLITRYDSVSETADKLLYVSKAPNEVNSVEFGRGLGVTKIEFTDGEIWTLIPHGYPIPGSRSMDTTITYCPTKEQFNPFR